MTVKIFNILIRKNDYIIRYFLRIALFFYKYVLRFVKMKDAVEHRLSTECVALLRINKTIRLSAHRNLNKNAVVTL